MKKFKDENGNIVSEKEYAQRLVRELLVGYSEIDALVENIEKVKDVNKLMDKLREEWIIYPDAEEFE